MNIFINLFMMSVTVVLYKFNNFLVVQPDFALNLIS